MRNQASCVIHFLYLSYPFLMFRAYIHEQNTLNYWNLIILSPNFMTFTFSRFLTKFLLWRSSYSGIYRFMACWKFSKCSWKRDSKWVRDISEEFSNYAFSVGMQKLFFWCVFTPKIKFLFERRNILTNFNHSLVTTLHVWIKFIEVAKYVT